jgi:glutamine amidotransferase
MKLIGIIDYQMSNLYSVYKAIEEVNGVPKIISNPNELKTISKVILPGVGSFDSALHSLQNKNFIEPLKTYIKNGMPFLGICLGFQLLLESSEEGKSEGLGIVQGRVKKFDKKLVKNVPHIGWNSIQITNYESPLWGNFNTSLWFYFIHSYYVCLDNKNIESAFTQYNNFNFTVSISLDNIMAVQFHPEKSSRSGLTILKNFITSFILQICSNKQPQ